MGHKEYLVKILVKHKIGVSLIGAVYVFAWIGAVITGNVDGAQPTPIDLVWKFLLLTILLLIPSSVIYLDSHRNRKHAEGFVVAGLVLNIYALIAYFIKRKELKRF